MNEFRRMASHNIPADPLADPLDALLADIAINIQLPPGLHAKACRRYDSLREHLSRPGSPLADIFVRLYTQGSMAIDATISMRGTDDEYDLDAVTELDVPLWMPPDEVLDLLFRALEGYPVEVVRQSRCVTLLYADKMHIDVTPARRIPCTPDFESVIFHANPEEPRWRHAEIPMNARGFADWYKGHTPLEDAFSKAYDLRVHDAYDLQVKAEPIVHDVPDQVPYPQKSVTTVALQLIKRFRNIRSADRPGRYPPSVMLSCHAGHAAIPGMALSDMVVRQARWTAREIERAASRGAAIDVRNPTMYRDRFTDRWPENLEQQADFATALHDLANGIEYLRRGSHELEDLQDWLRDRFGSLVVSRSVKMLNERNGAAIRDRQHRYTSSGGLYVPVAPAIVGASSLSDVGPRRHTNMGERR